MFDELYVRQKDFNLNTKQHIAVIGVGGIGFWAATFLAMAGIEELTLYDPDTIETHNLSRLMLPINMVGKNKADVTKRMIKRLRPDCKVYAYPFPFSTFLPGEEPDWLLDCTDSIKVQVENMKVANESGVKYCKAGYDGMDISIHNKVSQWGDMESSGYEIIPSFVCPAVTVASFAVFKVLKDEKMEMSTSIPDIVNKTKIV